MEAIAMKMTKKEFDSIKGLLPKITDVDFDLKVFPYLTNNYNNILGDIGSTDESISILNNRKFYEYFDKDIFLKACDIEVDKVWKGSEIEFRPNGFEKWICNLDYEFRLKPQPNYSKEIESLQEKAKINGMKAIITFEKI